MAHALITIFPQGKEFQRRTLVLENLGEILRVVFIMNVNVVFLPFGVDDLTPDSNRLKPQQMDA